MFVLVILLLACVAGGGSQEVCHAEGGDRDVGESWDENCARCRCEATENGPQIGCVGVSCPMYDASAPCIKWDNSSCCQVCDEWGCLMEGQVYPIGHTLSPSPCVTCTCQEGGRAICSSTQCAAPSTPCMYKHGRAICCEATHIEGTCCGYDVECPPDFYE